MAIYSKFNFHCLKLLMVVLFTTWLGNNLYAQTIGNVSVEVLPTEVNNCYGCAYTIASITISENEGFSEAFGRTGTSNSNVITISVPTGYEFTDVGNDVVLSDGTDVTTLETALMPTLSDDAKEITFSFKTGALEGENDDVLTFSDIVLTPLEGEDSYGETIVVTVDLDGAGNDSIYKFTGYSMEEPSFDFISYTTSNSCGYAQTDITFEIIDTASSVIKPTLSGSYFYYGAAGC